MALQRQVSLLQLVSQKSQHYNGKVSVLQWKVSVLQWESLGDYYKYLVFR